MPARASPHAVEAPRAARFGAGAGPDAFRFCVATGRINNCCVRLITVGLGSTGASSASDAPMASLALSPLERDVRIAAAEMLVALCEVLPLSLIHI